MGIPSYYKKLLDTNPGLVTKSHPDKEIQWLFMDFNCLIYHCLHREDTPVYPGHSDKESWEKEFIECIVRYCLKVIRTVDPKNGVYIAMDGVVPMAKMKQQRLRRFKSSWLSKHSKEAKESDQPKWDTNSITPGTLFMNHLHSALHTMISNHSKSNWIFSSSNEPGEGEHKIISYWRNHLPQGPYAIYGLDADLIVLSLLGYETCSLQQPIWLFREEIHKGKIHYDRHGEEFFEWFSILHLRNWLSIPYLDQPELQHSFLLNYCFAMSILGNDFLPTSFSFRIRDDAHSDLLTILHQLISDQYFMIQSPSLQLHTPSILHFFSLLAKNEPQRILSFLHKKQSIQRYSSRLFDLSPPSIGDDDWPLLFFEENILLTSTNQLSPSWQQLYLTHFFKGFTYNKKTIHQICTEYLYGLQWIWSYYTGQSSNICFNWYYPFSLPPLWQWISNEFELPSFPQSILLTASDIQPVEQLALVLPLDSWSLIPSSPQKLLPQLAPQFYPDSFSFDTIGKRFFWECESLIPLPTIFEIKQIIQYLCN
jgi:5'-3' exonuclease